MPHMMEPYVLNVCRRLLSRFPVEELTEDGLGIIGYQVIGPTWPERSNPAAMNIA